MQKILEFLDRKVKYIKKKIFEILRINIDEVHLLFIFQKSTFEFTKYVFCSKYNMPFILFNHKTNNFETKDLKCINYENLEKETSLEENFQIWKSALEYQNDNIEEDNNREITENMFNEDIEEEEESSEDENLNQDDIISNKDFSLNYFNK